MTNYRGEAIIEIWEKRLVKYVDLKKLKSIDAESMAEEIKEILKNPSQTSLGKSGNLENLSHGQFANETSTDQEFLQFLQKERKFIQKTFITTKTGKKVEKFRLTDSFKINGKMRGGTFVSKHYAEKFGVI